MQNYTPEDLIRYLYHEMSTEEAVAIEEELPKNWSLREKLAVIRTAQERLNKLIEAPRTEVVLNILKYASKTDTVISS
jgi:predicted GIY-YIG superfamily endonuclease